MTRKQKIIVAISIKLLLAAAFIGGYYTKSQVIKWNWNITVKPVVKVVSGDPRFEIYGWWFDNDRGGCRAKSYGAGVYDIGFARPDRWNPPILHHFIGVGPGVGLANGRIVYGGQLAYTYRFNDRIGIRPSISVLANQYLDYDINSFLTVEYGVK